MMTLLAARLDRRALILINARLDGYPAHFQVEPAALAYWLGESPGHPADVATLVETCWPRLAPVFERLVRRHGNDFVIDLDMLEAAAR